ncbi:MAG: C39 family peptidase [Polyangiaceae bacterium]|nr:C39 family peptidase [Polyangiaceae bacterium]
MRSLFVALLSAVASLAACGAPGAPPTAESSTPPPISALDVSSQAPNLPSVLVPDIPHVLQKPDFCGEAVTEMWLRSKGVSVDQNAVFNLSGMDPARGMGATTRELKQALTQLGFDTGPVWLTARASNAKDDLNSLFRDLHADLTAGVPSIVCTHYDERPNTTEHFRLVLGYDGATDEVIYNDPAVPGGAYLRMSRTRFLSLWPLQYDPASLTVIRLRLDGAPKNQSNSQVAGFAPADYAQHVLALKPQLRPEYTVVIEPPFVVVGDESPDRVKKRAETTVRWAVQKLKQDFFKKDPSKILTIWLFGTKGSYDRHVRLNYDREPSTPYGFFSAEHASLVMNISTGGGTLVHEIVHPFVAANLPDCPAWLNEGLGSLFEQSDERNGHIIGNTNWRLAGLQRAIQKKVVPSFHTLTHTTINEFYEEDPGSNYAQSRYLLYYLQEHGLLLKFWNQYLQDRNSDPSGYTSLLNVLGEKDLTAFQKKWEAEVLTLTFP